MRYKGIFLIAVTVFALSFTSIAQYPVTAYNGKTLPAPKGMTYIPGGSIIIKYGQNDSDSSSYKKISLSSFYIDKTEVTNKQYREFIDWVIDSVAVTTYLKGNGDYFLKTNSDSTRKRINWKKAKNVMESKSRDIQNQLAPMYAHDEIRKDLYVFTFPYLKTAPGDKDKGSIIIQSINVYPDTKVWSTDFPNSQTDLMVQEYFKNRAYDDYPVVGVTWLQATAYAHWRTKMAQNKRGNKYLRSYQLPYSLPSEAQWVYAAQGQAQGSKDSTIVPRDKNNVLLANFKQGEGDYTEDGSSYTVPVMSYAPNQFGLYNMYGNVAEWILDAYNESAWAFVHDQNPVLLYDADNTESDYMKRKVVRGGSWKDNGASLSPYTRDYEVQDVPHSYIGFRCVMAAPEILGKKVRTRKESRRGRKAASNNINL